MPFAQETANAAGTTNVPIGATVTHIGVQASAAGNATIDIASLPTITVLPNQTFELPPGALSALRGPVAIAFGGNVARRYVSWRT